MAKVICVLYDDPVTGYPKTYARDAVAQPERYPDGQTLPTPKGIDFNPGTLLGSVSGGPLVVSCGNQQSQSLVVVEPCGHVGRLHLSLSTCP